MGMNIDARGHVIINRHGKAHFTPFVWYPLVVDGSFTNQYHLSPGRTAIENYGALHITERTGSIIFSGEWLELTEAKFLELTKWEPKIHP